MILGAICVLAICCLLGGGLPVATAGDQTARVKQAITKTFGPRADEALRVAYCESRFNPRAVSPTRDVGVFQINYRWHARPGESFASFRRRMSKINVNVRKAYRLSQGGTNWRLWTCQP